jgi:hypothetical protein
LCAAQRWAHPRTRRLWREEACYDNADDDEARNDSGGQARDDSGHDARDNSGGQACDDPGDDSGYDARDNSGGQACDDPDDSGDPDSGDPGSGDSGSGDPGSGDSGSRDSGSRSSGSRSSGSRSPVVRIRRFDGRWIGPGVAPDGSRAGAKLSGSVELLVQGNDEESGIRICVRIPLCLFDECLLMNTGR